MPWRTPSGSRFHSVRVAGIYRHSDLHAALFFAFFMLTDPPTSPPRYEDQVIYGALVAALSYGIFTATKGGVYYLLAALLLANAWEAWRRVRQRSTRHAHPLHRTQRT